MCLGELGMVRGVLADGTLVVDVRGRTTMVSGLLLDRRPGVGEWVLAHSGFALTVLDEDEARDALAVRAGGGS